MAVTRPSSPPPAVGHLIHVGYPKTGSKFLQGWFARHPDLLFWHWGIGGFRDAHAMVAAAAAPPLPRWHVTSHEALLTPVAQFEDPAAGEAPIRLPTRDGQRSACAMLESLFPSARILIVTRGYRSLIRSFYAELVLGGAGYAFRDFCDALLAQVEAGTDVFHLDAALDAYAAGFGEERLLVLPYELLRDRPDDFLGAIETRLAIGPLPTPSIPIRPSPSAARLEAYRRMTRRVRAVPGPAGLKRRGERAWVSAMRSGRFAALAAAIEKRGGGEEAVPLRLIEALAGRSERLRGDPLYKGYAADYLL